ncbi:MAG: glycosyl hydrolase [Verrucomicrobiota bacterium]
MREISFGRTLSLSCLLLLTILLPAITATSENSPTEQQQQAQFKNPPAEFRILKLIHNWPAATEAQDKQIQWLVTNGFGGMACNVPFDKGYVENETNWNIFQQVVKDAKKQNLFLWLYDEKGYPSGNAGGIVLRDHPEWEARGLLIADAETSGTNVTLAVPPGSLMLAAAFPIQGGRIDLAGRLDLAGKIANKQLTWQPAPGQWRVMVITEDHLYEGTHADHNVYAHIPYVNLLQPEPTAYFLKATHQRYADRLDANLGKWFMSTFTDEPSLMSLFLSPMPYRVLPWAPNLPVEFKRRRGYDLVPKIPALIAEAGPEGAKARYDFWLTVGELVSENYFGQIQDWCRQHQVASGGHLLFEESLLYQVASYGDFYRCIRRLDAPGIDMLTSLPPEVPHYIARLLSSAGELHGRTLVMSETSDHSQRYRSPGDKRPVRVVTEAEMRGTFNRQMVSGVNCFTSYYSYKDLTQEQLLRLNEWVGRCCAMLRGLPQQADLAVVYPTESLWPRFIPSRHYVQDATAAQQIASTYVSTVNALFGSGQDYTIIDSTALAAAQAQSKRLVHGNLEWRMVILPAVDTLPLAAWENLAAFVRAGGVAVALGALPANSEKEFPDPRVQQLAREIFGANPSIAYVQANPAGGGGIFLPSGSEGLLPRLLKKIVPPRLLVGDKRSPLRTTHRGNAGNHFDYLINDSAEAWSGTVSFPRALASGPQSYALWHPATGAMEPVAGAANLALKLGPYDAVFFHAKDSLSATAAAKTQSPLKTGALPGLVSKPIAPTQAQVSGGEFVQKQVAPDSTHSTRELPAWRAIGVLTKSQVDTHLFLRLPYTNRLDLTGTEYVVIDTWVPDNQSTGPQLLVMLHEKGGADYLANSGRSLGKPGLNRTYLPIQNFSLAGWSKDDNGRLDLDAITEIRIGWGGHFGQQGDHLEFSVALPQVVRDF